MRAMSRRTLAALVFGWLLGIMTALMTPTLVYQQQSIRMVPGEAAQLDEAIASGWYVTRRDDPIVTLERPRFRLP
jgi:hypothetical protein